MARVVPSQRTVSPSLRLLGSVALAWCCLGGSAEAQPHRLRGVIHQQYIALLNPIGMEHTLRVGARQALGDQANVFFDGAHAEAGLVGYLSPVYAVHGAYLEVSPLSFLVLHAELTGHVVWPLGMDASGYYGLQGYERPSVDVLRADLGASATGWSMRVGGTLQGAVPITSGVRIVIADDVTVQRGALGDRSHYYDMKWDLVLAREDWVVINSAALLLEVRPEPSQIVRAGAYDDLRVVPASGYASHQAGLLFAFTFLEVAPEVPALTLFLRAGYHTHHVLRTDPTVLGGVAVDYDLGAIR